MRRVGALVSRGALTLWLAGAIRSAALAVRYCIRWRDLTQVLISAGGLVSGVRHVGDAEVLLTMSVYYETKTSAGGVAASREGIVILVTCVSSPRMSSPIQMARLIQERFPIGGP